MFGIYSFEPNVYQWNLIIKKTMSNEKSNNQQDEGEDSYYEEDQSISKRQKTQNDQSDETPLTKHE